MATRCSSKQGRCWSSSARTVATRTEVGGLKVATDAGNEHIVLSEDEIEAFRAKLEPVVERWIAEVVKKGIDGRALVRAAREAINAYERPSGTQYTSLDRATYMLAQYFEQGNNPNCPDVAITLSDGFTCYEDGPMERIDATGTTTALNAESDYKCCTVGAC